MALPDVLLGILVVISFLLLILVGWVVVDRRSGREAVDGAQLTNAINQSLDEVDFKRNLTLIENHAQQISQLHTDLSQMLQNPQQRGRFGEQQLELLLEDHLPPDRFGIDEAVVEGKRPDAHIQTSAGVVCIDSKFPLDNYRKFLDVDDEATRDQLRDAFRSDVSDRLAEISSKYVRPESGTASFAFGFIPSESVYHHLITEEYDLLQEATQAGVQVVSPLTLGHKLELISADIRTQQLSEQAERIRDDLTRLDRQFADLDDKWGTMQTHVRNAESKAREVDDQLTRLRDEFDRITQQVDES